MGAAAGRETTSDLLVFEDLRVETAAGRVIIERSSARLKEGELGVLIGMSGAGKSLLTTLILGCLDPEATGLKVSGRILLDGVDLLTERGPEERRQLGAVFQLQHPGLFDDLTVDQNLVFAGRGQRTAADWRRELNLEEAPQLISRCSGGQRQRVALGRTLHQGASVLLYDEPTTGLDPDAAETAVGLIQQYHRRGTLVITHDFEAFLPHADRVLLLDPVSRCLEDVTDQPDARALIQERARLARRQDGPTPGRSGSRWLAPLRWVPQTWARAALAVHDLVMLALALPLVLPRFAWRALFDWRIRRQTLRTVGRFFSPGAVAFIATSALLLGMVVTFFVFERLPMRSYTEPLVVDDVLDGIGFTMFRIAGPLITTILVAAKLGANLTAQVGQMRYHRQVDALRVFRVSPLDYLLWPLVLGFLVGTLFLVGVAILVSSLTSLVVFIHGHLDLTPRYWWSHYSRHLTEENLLWVLYKTVTSAVGVGLIAYRSGMQPKHSSTDITRAINQTLLWSLLWVLVVHAGFAFIEY